jgi:hypothetical protein
MAEVDPVLHYWVRPVINGLPAAASQAWALRGTVITDAGLNYGLAYDAEETSLSWFLTLPGDGNEDGLVTVQDMTPTGTHAGKPGPFTRSDMEWNVDYDGDGSIDIFDWSLLQWNCLRGVTDYAVYFTPFESQVPVDPFAPEVRTPLDVIPTSAGEWSQEFSRAYQFEVTETDGWYWVRPLRGTAVGAPSEVIFVP